MFPSDAEIIEAANKTQKETGKGTDAIAADETLSARLRANLPEEYATVSCVKLTGRAVVLRKKGDIENVGNGSGQRSESDLEHEGCEQLGGSRLESVDVYRWTKTEAYMIGVREPVKVRDRHRCQFCYSPNRLQVHHRSYKRCRTIFEVEDCITLCRTCHGYVHDAWKKRKTGKPSPLQTELEGFGDEHE